MLNQSERGVDLLSVDIGHGGQRFRCLVPLTRLLVLGRCSLEIG